MRFSSIRLRHCCVALVLAALPGCNEVAPPTTQSSLKEIGKWDGVTETAELTRPYEDPRQQQIPPGMRSYDLAPWRAYMDTWPATRYLRMPGVTFDVSPQEAPATAQFLGEAGIRTAKLEVSRGILDTDEENVRSLLKALRNNRIRPLLSLNSGSEPDGWPQYLGTATKIATEEMGTGTDAGFDIEVSTTFLPLTTAYVNDPANHLTGVRVISGIAVSDWDSWRLIAPENTDSIAPLVDALGRVSRRGMFVHHDSFAPTLRIAMPESGHFGYDEKFLTRDLQPLGGHGRFGNPGVWQTELTDWRAPWAESLVKENGVSRDDPRFSKLMQHLGTKAMLRAFIFHSHKGVTTSTGYSAKATDTSLGVIPQGFFEALADDNYELTPRVRAEAGAALAAIQRVDALMRTGNRAVDVARPLSVSKVVEHRPRLVYRGDGTPAHPDAYNRDDFAVLPWALDDHRFAVAFYVVTRNMAHEWDETKDLLDPARYDMPEQGFDLTLNNLHSNMVKIVVLDPITGQRTHPAMLDAGPRAITVRLQSTDYPRLLIIDEISPGPLIMAPSLRLHDDGSATVSAVFPQRVKGVITWGALPVRTGSGELRFDGDGSRTFSIPELAVGEGVRITAVADGLSAVWPRWNHDTAAVRQPAE